jgi:hypothetical protein
MGSLARWILAVVAAVAVIVLLVMATLNSKREQQLEWSPDSAEGQAAARVVAFSRAAQLAERNALANSARRDVSTVYAKDLEELVGPHCVDDAWKSLSGGFGDPTTFDPNRESIRHVKRLNDGRMEVHVVDARTGHAAEDRIFQLESVGGDWLVKRFFHVGRRPQAPAAVPVALAEPPPALTLPKQLGLAELVPAVVAVRRQAIALHPFRVTQVSADSSHFGGVMLGNAPADWPRCDLHNSAHVGVLQLLREDFPAFRFLDETDVFQLTWCPFDHDLGLPDVRVRWLKRSKLAATQPSNPEHRWPVYDYVPRPCRVYCDVFDEYAIDPDSLTPETREAILSCAALRHEAERDGKTLSDDGILEYCRSYYGPYPGTKLMGHPSWVQSPEMPSCHGCNKPMTLLLAIESWEPWSAQKEARRPTQLPPGTPVDPTGLMIGDAGCAYVFVCYQCDGWPVVAVMQCP